MFFQHFRLIHLHLNNSEPIQLAREIHCMTKCTLYEIYFHEPYHNKTYTTRYQPKRESKKRDKVFLNLIHNMTIWDESLRYNIEQVKQHPYFNKVTFPEYNYIQQDDICDRIKHNSSLFISKCMNETMDTCLDYTQIDHYTSSILKFKIIDLFQK